jgi:hypothetical protein
MKLTKTDFDIATLEDELRVDSLCRELLLAFYYERLSAGLSEHDATLLANSADFVVRDYLIGTRQLNILETSGGVLRKFAGNWYIVNTLDPTITELEGHLRGINEFFSFLADHGAITPEALAEIAADCHNGDYYRRRIDSFLAITGDGYYAWEEECSLKND